MRKGLKRCGILFLLLLVLAALGMGIYLGNYYHVDGGTKEYLQSTKSVQIEKTSDRIVFQPSQCEKALIFYPGGKVQFESYAPILAKLAQKHNVLCILVHMPGNLAVLRPSAADGLQEAYPNIAHWYIGGHSLGGAMAASYVAGHAGDYDGMVLLGAYPTKDLSKTDLKLLSLYGSEDQVLNRESYEENRSNWPKQSVEHVIQGGNHANFGFYGAQKGDGKATISQEDQWQESVGQIGAFMKN